MENKIIACRHRPTTVITLHCVTQTCKNTFFFFKQKKKLKNFYSTMPWGYLYEVRKKPNFINSFFFL